MEDGGANRQHRYPEYEDSGFFTARVQTIAAIATAVFVVAGGFWYLANWAGQIDNELRGHRAEMLRDSARLDELERHGSPQAQDLIRRIEDVGRRMGQDEATMSTMLNNGSVQAERLAASRSEAERMRQQIDRMEQDVRTLSERLTRVERYSNTPGR